MRNYLGALGVSAVFALTLTAYTAQRNPDERPRLTVVVCDKAGLAAETLRGAKTHAMGVFADAGIDLTWVETEGDRSPMQFIPTSLEGCLLPSTSGDFWVVISNESPHGWPAQGLGFALPTSLPPYRVYVFYDRVQIGLAAPRVADASILLGSVIVHELGHLLLADAAHTPTGIMSTGWRYDQVREAEQGLLRFHPDQARRIQSELRSTARLNASRPAESPVLRSAR